MLRLQWTILILGYSTVCVAGFTQDDYKEFVDSINNRAHTIAQAQPDSCLMLAQSALELSKENNYLFGEAKALFNIGNAYLFKIDVKNAITYYLSSASLFEKSSPSEAEAELLLQIGLINNYTGNYSRAIEYFRRSGLVYSVLKDQESLINIYHEIGLAFAQAQSYDSAFHYLRYALSLGNRMNDFSIIADIYNDMGLVFLWINENDPGNEKIDGHLAINYLDSSLYFGELAGKGILSGGTLCNLGEAYGTLLEPPDYINAERYCKLGLSELRKTKSIISIANVYAFMGRLYIKNGEMTKSKAYLDSSLYMIKFHRDNVKEWVYEYPQAKLNSMKFKYWSSYWTYNNLHSWYDDEGKYDSAMYYYRLAQESLDSINSIKSRFQIDYLLAEADNQRLTILQSESELNRYRAIRNMQWLIGLIFLVIIIFILVFVIIRQNRLKASQEKTSLQQKLFRLQMNPHFIFNSLGSIQSAIIDKDNNIAIKYISKFSKMMRNILEGTLSEFTTLSKEIKLVENYLDLQMVRFKGKFNYKIVNAENIDTDEIFIPSFVLQPFIENAIEHGIIQKGGLGLIEIRIQQKNDYTVMEIIDNGIGREKANEIRLKSNKNHKPMATNITRERLKLLNKNLKQKIHFDIIDLKDENGNASGTRVVFEIPLSL